MVPKPGPDGNGNSPESLSKTARSHVKREPNPNIVRIR